MPRLSVVVPTFERPGRLPGLVAALEAQTIPVSDFDVIISDDASRDETPEVLADLMKRSPLRLRAVRNERNRGPGAARNLAWRQSDAPVIAFTDDDCVPTPGWLEAGLRALEDPSIGIVQGRTIPDPSAPGGSWAVSQRLERFTDRYETCNIFYRTDVLRAVDGFDDEMYFGEDTVAGWNARRRGVAATFAPGALVHHAVTHPKARFFWRSAMAHGRWATLVRRFPEMRREVLWNRVFVRRVHAALLGAIAGVVVGAVLWWPAFLLAVPYVWAHRPRAFHRDAILDQILAVGFEAAVVIGLVRGSIRERTLVL